jgi:acetyl-CoA C-acetyltransferase
MNQVYVIDALRTPFGSFGGVLADVPATELAATVTRALFERNNIDPSIIDQYIAGQVVSTGCGQAPARIAMRKAGLPDTVPAMTINKACGSGLKAMMLVADTIRLGDHHVGIAGGMENMSLYPYALLNARFGMRMGHDQVVDLLLYDALLDPESGRHMGDITEEALAVRGITREAQDEYAISSYQRAQAAIKRGFHAREIVPVVKSTRKGEVVIDSDEEPNRVDFDKFTSLRPAFKKDGTVTAGNASTINDGAAFALLASGAACEKHGLKAKARMIAYATNSLHPTQFPVAPIGAIERVCIKAGMTLDQIDLFEINTAFSAVALMSINKLNISRDKVNINGGAISIGHPVGASGGRLVATLLNGLEETSGRYGLATLCIGGGEAVAAIFERL